MKIKNKRKKHPRILRILFNGYEEAPCWRRKGNLYDDGEDFELVDYVEELFFSTSNAIQKQFGFFFFKLERPETKKRCN